MSGVSVAIADGPGVDAESLAASLKHHMQIDLIETFIEENLELLDKTPEEYFLPGIYVRAITLPVGSLSTTLVHATEHPYSILKGVAAVWEEDTGWELRRAPYHGVTKPGTRRIIYVYEEARWATFHPNPDNVTDLDELRKLLTKPKPTSQPAADAKEGATA